MVGICEKIKWYLVIGSSFFWIEGLMLIKNLISEIEKWLKKITVYIKDIDFYEI